MKERYLDEVRMAGATEGDRHIPKGDGEGLRDRVAHSVTEVHEEEHVRANGEDKRDDVRRQYPVDLPLSRLYLEYIELTHQCGSGTRCPSLSFPSGDICTLHVCTRAHTENKFASGPNVPARRGNPVDIIHHRLTSSVSSTMSSRSDCRNSLGPRVRRRRWVEEACGLVLLAVSRNILCCISATRAALAGL